MGRSAQLNVNKGPTVKDRQNAAITEVAVGNRKELGGKGKKERLFVIKFSLPEVSDTEAFSGCWNHSPATPHLIG